MRRRRLLSSLVVLALVCLVVAAGTARHRAGKLDEAEMERTISVTSTAFQPMAPIPPRYTCDGDDVSPPLAWSGLPEATRSLVLIVDDPDAPMGSWVHWVCYDIPPAVKSMPEGVVKADTLPGGGKQGISDFGRIGYGGPCPPAGTHRYFFKVYALDRRLNLRAGKSKADVEKAMRGHVLAWGGLLGVYTRAR